MRQSTWAAIQPGDFIVLHGTGIGARATLEDRTDDGSIIWIRNEFNERRLVHVDDCEEVRFVEITHPPPVG